MRHLIIIVLGMFFYTAAAVAQETEIPEAQKREPGTYYKLFNLEFKPGKTDDALEILRGKLVPAWRESGVKVQLIEFLLQTKDVMLLIELKEGPESLGYEVPKQDAEAWAALVSTAGNAASANEIVDRFIGYVARQSESLVFIRN